jgi:hypothetical protein
MLVQHVDIQTEANLNDTAVQAGQNPWPAESRTTYVTQPHHQHSYETVSGQKH